MGFWAGFIVAIPIGIYFGERELAFPLSFHRRERAWGYLQLDLGFMEAVTRDFEKLIGRNQHAPL